MMRSDLAYLIAFGSDACTLVVLSYLLARGSMIRVLFRERLSWQASALLGICLGLIGLMESRIPEAGFQYASSTLCIAFAASIGGLPVGLITTAVITVVTTLYNPRVAISLLPAIAISALMAKTIRRTGSIPLRLFYGFILGALSQACRLGLRYTIGNIWVLPPLPATALLSIPANGIGLVLLLLVVSEAQVRADSEQHRVEKEQKRAEAERAHALATEAQLSALRSRIHPHFLFNALNSITELCCIDPERAETACVNLSQLMRRTLDAGAAAEIPLRDELALVRAYTQIEQERLGERLHVVWKIPSACEEVKVIPFSIQMLVENAIRHGIANKMEPGTVSISVRCSQRRTLIAVCDDGVGIPRDTHIFLLHWDDRAKHGLQLLNQQLVLRYGLAARVRLFGRDQTGTLAAFAIPACRNSAPGRNETP